MPSGFTIDTGRRIVLQCAWGIVLGPRMVEHARALGLDPRFEPSFMTISDLRRVTDMQATSEDVRELAAASPFGAGSLRVTIVSSDEMFGLSRMFELLREQKGDVMHISRDLDDALEWLGIVQHKQAIVATLGAAPVTSFDP